MRGRLIVRSSKLESEHDQNDAGDSIERAADPLAVEELPGSLNGHAVRGQPAERKQRKEEAEAQKRGERVTELRQEAGEEDGHLRVRQVADEALPQPSPRRLLRRPEHAGRIPPAVSERSAQSLKAEKNEVCRTNEPERREGRL